jgi:CRISPR-associated endonuclease/helicase Cas3
MKYWAKTTKDGQPGIDVRQHMLRVAVVARLLSEQSRRLLESCGISPAFVSFLAGLHDIGKISPGFQSKCRAWLEQNGLLEQSVRNGWVNIEGDHSRVSQFSVQRLLVEFPFDMDRSSAIWWAASIGAHHGRLHYPGERGLAETAGMLADDWEKKRRETALQLLNDLNLPVNLSFSLPDVTSESPLLWLIAGLTSVADWIGSDEYFFPPDLELETEEAFLRTTYALDAIGLQPPKLRKDLSFNELFPFPPNPLQEVAMEYISAPGIYVIEAPMGTGKTEAALACAYRLLCSGDATGVYFALPTQATSNRIRVRLADFVRRICPDAPSTRLIHSNSWLMEEIAHLMPATTAHDDDDARRGRDWFTSPKRALIAPFGVGTVDQALLSVVAAKHFFVRRFALAGKVVIIDEVHSYDVYTGTLVGALCTELEKLGCTVILLSATLIQSRRNALLELPPPAGNIKVADPYPLISGRVAHGPSLQSVESEGPRPKAVKMVFLSEDDAVTQALEKARNGARILWICNTVAQAQQTYRLLRNLDCGSADMGLLHARFPHYRRIELEEYWMTALGKEGPRPSGCILVSTQIVEQSVDLDADLIITELAPTDMMLQRMGRLWRHERGKRPLSHPEYWIINEKESLQGLRQMGVKALKNILGSKAKVYSPFVLLKTLEVWAGRQEIVLPDDVRGILEQTYEDRDDLPPGWLELRNEIEGDKYARRMKAEMAANIFNLALPDEEGVQTRINEMQMVSLILARHFDGRIIKLLNGNGCHLKGGEFCLDDAKALHRNLVRVPKRIFALFQKTEATAQYVKGDQAVAIVENDGSIKINGLKQSVRITWDKDYGVEIFRDKEDIDESCD